MFESRPGYHLTWQILRDVHPSLQENTEIRITEKGHVLFLLYYFHLLSNHFIIRRYVTHAGAEMFLNKSMHKQLQVFSGFRAV